MSEVLNSRCDFDLGHSKAVCVRMGLAYDNVASFQAWSQQFRCRSDKHYLKF